MALLCLVWLLAVGVGVHQGVAQWAHHGPYLEAHQRKCHPHRPAPCVAPRRLVNLVHPVVSAARLANKVMAASPPNCASAVQTQLALATRGAAVTVCYKPVSIAVCATVPPQASTAVQSALRYMLE